MLLSVLETRCTLCCNPRTWSVVVHCNGAWLSRCELCGLCAAMGVGVVSVWLQTVP
jgi:hypothetical protein